jgi:CDP-diacylglycerol--glycerol-3-phosphate 3-phosphatidyltransferase
VTAPVQRPPVVNVANGLTLVRLVLVPVMAVLLAASAHGAAGWRLDACLVFCIASATDFWDGKIARSRNLVTSFGQVADPIADKALTGTALAGLSWLGLLPWWVTVLILVREIGVTALRLWVIRHGVIPASRGGKLKTLLQVVAIAWYLAPLPGGAAAAGPWIMGAAVVVTVVSGADYVLRAVTLRRAGRALADTAAAPVPEGELPL